MPIKDGLTILCQIVGVLELNWAHTIEIWQGYIGRGIHEGENLIDMFLFWIFVPLENLIWRRTSPLPVKGCKIWPILGTHGYWAVRVFSVPHSQWHGASVYNGLIRGPVTLTAIAELLAEELSLPVNTCFYDLRLSRLRFQHHTFCVRGECAPTAVKCDSRSVHIFESFNWFFDQRKIGIYFLKCSITVGFIRI